MALKPTIYKFRISLSDMNRDLYTSSNLTVAQHPSETERRMVARLIAYCHGYSEDLEFTKGLSTTDEPDLWEKELHGDIRRWVELGEPDADRVKKASRVAERVSIYGYNTSAGQWWQQNQNKIRSFCEGIYQIDTEALDQFAAALTRTMDLSVMISGTDIYVDTGSDSIAVSLETLHSQD
ncbi:YaeQ family protein [Vibrio sp. WXL103]|uniref:YaeQ family protein n=1 Tax=Vibrio sp. WXL103 TaxID=3450710 RepID=UPI0030E05B8F